jgi:2-polyprenyl-3-methyl-5-hydroxy-6-metoxy-1,4-benzoquinol methylase
MSDKVDLYKTQYTYDRIQIYKQIRGATYGQDLGQSSWITLEEAKGFLGWLELGPSSKALEVACGVGGVSCLIASQFGTEVHGVGISEEAVNTAIARSLEQELGDFGYNSLRHGIRLLSTGRWSEKDTVLFYFRRLFCFPLRDIAL